MTSNDLIGYLLPWIDDRPVVLTLADCDDLFIPVFSDENRLMEAMVTVNVQVLGENPTFLSIMGGVQFTSIKKIDDGTEFFASVKDSERETVHVRVIADPHVTDTGMTHYTEIVR